MKQNMQQRILVVDDRSENLLALERILEDTGALLIKATSGEEALAASLYNEFAMALLDVQMPGMDGFELAELLRGDPKTRSLPIIFLTAASVEDEEVFRGYETGAVDYIIKPINPQILISKVNVFLELARQRQEIIEYQNELERLVQERTRELERSNRDLQQFAYVASHDLQEPLRMVTSYTQLLAKRYQDQLDEKAHRFINYAVEGAFRMQKQIKALLDFSRVETRGKPLEPTDSGKVLNDILNIYSQSIQEVHAEIVTEKLPFVLSDEIQLGQIFQNLISNALKFRKPDEPLCIKVYSEEMDEFQKIIVEDNGIGFEPKYSDRIFVIFQRLHLRESYPGNGIGLAMVKRIVERHGGEISVETQPGKGCKFCFTLKSAASSSLASDSKLS